MVINRRLDRLSKTQLVPCTAVCSMVDNVLRFVKVSEKYSTRLTMSILQYFHRKTPPQQTGIGTKEANASVEKELCANSAGTTRKRKRYTSFTDKDRAMIGKHAAENGNLSAQKRLKSSFPDLGESTVRLFKKKYLEAMKQRTSQGDSSPVVSLPSKRMGRPLTLGALDPKVQRYMRALRQAGAPVGTSVIIAAAKGIVLSVDRTMRVENGGHIRLTKTWAQSLMHRMGLVKRKASTKKSSITSEKFEEVKTTFLRQVGHFAKAHSVPADLLINWDQTGINVAPSSNYTMEERGAGRVEIAGYGDRRMITATFAATSSGKFLPMKILYGGKTDRCHPKHQFPSEFDIHHNPNHWANEECAIRFIEKIILPYIRTTREKRNSNPNQNSHGDF